MKVVDYLQYVLNDGNHLSECYKEILRLSSLYKGSWSKKGLQFRDPRGSASSKRNSKGNIFTYKRSFSPNSWTEKEWIGLHILSAFYMLTFAIVSTKVPKKDLDIPKLLSTAEVKKIKRLEGKKRRLEGFLCKWPVTFRY